MFGPLGVLAHLMFLGFIVYMLKQPDEFLDQPAHPFRILNNREFWGWVLIINICTFCINLGLLVRS